MTRPMPFDLVDRYAKWRWEVVWDLTPEAPTYRMTNGEARRFVKLAPSGNALPDEAQRLRFAGAWLPCPRVIEYGSDGDTDWLMTEELPGVDATKHPWFATEPARLARTLGEGLRHFHSLVRVEECPFEFGTETAVRHVKARLAAGLISTPDAVERLLATVPEPGAEVVCHGDYCLPNVFFTGDEITGYLDLGRLAIVDPWWDLACGSGSVTRNLGPDYEQDFFQGYGIAPDPERIAWYRLLYDLS
ncbi:aminoglycoside 3'-phosphotransferase [Catelliglobosispora koreensis]|uniref:aminoglycoside 3'-phosphotransferase n=1 Tax=Catelliglobosispora koreensis TaxID=129052 RepID=UPI00036221F0|nr:aminoglycoside 3'-phosphotransferase [Catelliglobosispora koreensis]